MKKKYTYLLLLSMFGCATLHAQYTKLLDFIGYDNGRYPLGDLYYDDTFLYGLTQFGGQQDQGTLFKVKTDGTDFLKLHDFSSSTGFNPSGNVISDGVYLYGMTGFGGTNGKGTIFKIKKDGSDFTPIFEFAGISNGGYPHGSLFFDGTYLYGMTQYGGSYDGGVIFKIQTDGTGYVVLREFTDVMGGASPWGSFTYDGTYLYGYTYGGANNCGTIFKIKTDGSDFTKIYDFSTTSGTQPRGVPLLDGSFLYGVTFMGGTNNVGTVFKIQTDGTGFVKLLDFDTSINGGKCSGSLITDGTYLYGLSTFGGNSSMGNIYKIKNDGTEYTKLLDFSSDVGREPNGSLISDGTTFYGMTWKGGTTDGGVVFKFGELISGLQETENHNTHFAYPNPANNFVTINNIPNNSTLIVTDLTGKVLYSSSVISKQTTISTTNFENGAYFIQIANKESVSNSKLIVNR